MNSLIQAFLDGELSPAEKVLFERELAESPELAGEVQAARAVSARLYESLGAAKRGRDLTTAVMAHLPEMEGGYNYSRQEIARELTWRSKHPRSRSHWFMTLLPALAPAVLLVLGALIFQAWPFSEETQPRVVGMLTALGGGVVLHDDQLGSAREASLLARVHGGDLLATDDNAYMLVALAGPTILKASTDSRIKVLGPRAIQVEKGRVWLDVAKHPERFRVHTSMGDVTVFGTVFSVEAEPNQVTVTLKEGEVTVENDSDFAVLYPDEQAVMRHGMHEIIKSSVDAGSLLAWADEITEEPAAQAEFVAAVEELSDGLLHAEQVWWVDTKDRVGVRAMAFTWDGSGAGVAPMSYDVLVYNENMQPLFSRRLDGALLGQSETRQVELEIPEGKSIGGKTTFVRLVPDESTGTGEVAFREVSFIGAPAPAAL